jgi:hypothetical protein
MQICYKDKQNKQILNSRVKEPGQSFTTFAVRGFWTVGGNLNTPVIGSNFTYINVESPCLKHLNRFIGMFYLSLCNFF